MLLQRFMLRDAVVIDEEGDGVSCRYSAMPITALDICATFTLVTGVNASAPR